MNLVMVAQAKRILTIINLLLSVLVAILGIIENGNALKMLSKKGA